MNIAEELAKIEALHKSGALSDDEFAKAKATLLNSPQPTSRNTWAGNVIGCGVWLVILAIAAYFVMPWASKAWKEFSAKMKEAEEAHEQAALLLGAGVQRLDAELNQGVFSHDLLLINKGDDILTEATLDLIMVKGADGSKTESK